MRGHGVGSATEAAMGVDGGDPFLEEPVLGSVLIDGPPRYYSASGGTSGSSRAINAGRLFCTVSHTRPTSISK